MSLLPQPLGKAPGRACPALLQQRGRGPASRGNLACCRTTLACHPRPRSQVGWHVSTKLPILSKAYDIRDHCWAGYPLNSRRRPQSSRPRPLTLPDNISLLFLPPYAPELNPKENLWDEIREKTFKNYALKSIDAVRAKLKQAILYIERNPTMVKSITTFPYIAKSL